LPDHRRHRGPHPQDRQLFCAEAVPDLQAAASDLAWLLTRGYASASSLKLAGDRYALDARQRTAVARCACGDAQRERRRRHQLPANELRGEELWIDGYNVLTSLEAALSGGVVLHARDGCYRDLASMHGSYRKVEETLPAIEILGELIASWGVAACRWLLDQPVSNSGRLKTMLREIGEANRWPWQIELVADPDTVLKRIDQIVATSDSDILDHAQRWFNLARTAIERRVSQAWIVDLSGSGSAVQPNA